MTRVLVLMSTWNGMRHLEDQVASILAQEGVEDLCLMVRDDGSSDGTAEWLAGRDPDRIRVIAGQNIGARASFLELLRLARQEDADFIALADQDDVWQPGKVAAAVGQLRADAPMLYASAVDLVDGDLRPIGRYVHPGDRSFASTLMCNFVTGCTCVLTRPMLDALAMPANPARIMMHDWWLAALATAFGEVVYDPVSRIAHRQHGANQVGISQGARGLWRRVERMLSAPPEPSRLSQAEELRQACGDRLDPDLRQLLDRFIAASVSLPGRLRLVASGQMRAGAMSTLRYVLRP